MKAASANVFRMRVVSGPSITPGTARMAFMASVIPSGSSAWRAASDHPKWSRIHRAPWRSRTWAWRSRASSKAPCWNRSAASIRSASANSGSRSSAFINSDSNSASSAVRSAPGASDALADSIAFRYAFAAFLLSVWSPAGWANIMREVMANRSVSPHFTVFCLIGLSISPFRNAKMGPIAHP